jgi:hypothetical protein
MSAYKKLNKQDAFITTYTAHKTWAVTGSELSLYGIEEVQTIGLYTSSLKQLYYPTKSENNQVYSSFDYYPQTTLHFKDSRRDFITSKLISIPRNLYGIHINPNSIQVEAITPSVNSNGQLISGSTDRTTIWDDGEGNLYGELLRIGSGNKPTPLGRIGDVIYPHGILNITSGSLTIVGTSEDITSIIFKSSHPIFTHNYHCKIRESELNYTYNPSALSGSLKTVYDNNGNIYSTSASVSDGVISNNVTGSEFQPYITTIGLYNDANELIAVGKLNRPVPKSQNTEMTIIVKIDI